MKNKNIKLSAIGFLIALMPILSIAAETIDSDPTSPIIPGTMQVGGIPTQTNQTSGSVPAPTQSSGTSGSLPAPTTKSTTGKTQTISLPNPLGTIKTIPELIGRLVDWLIFIASIAILPAMIVWGAYQLLTAGGNPDAVTSARHTITWAVVGYALLLISKGIEFIIRDVLTRGA